MLKNFKLAFLALCISTQLAVAGIPQSLNYQAYLTDSVGSVVNGSVEMTFNIYNVETGGAPLWTDTQMVFVTNGLFDVNLSGPFPPDLFDAPLWLGLSVGFDAEMLPRRPILTAAYAFRSQIAEQVIAGGIDSDALAPGAVTEQSLATGSVTAEKIGATCAAGETLINTLSGWQCGSFSGTSCTPGDFLNCYTGAPGTAGIGVCQNGVRNCVGGVGFGSCEGEVVPDLEVCDTLDNDCDGFVDNDAVDIATWYEDLDGDGFGIDANSVIECFMPPGFVDQGGDCDDNLATTFPGAVEVCNGVDDDCNLIIDDNCTNQVCSLAEVDAINVCLDTCGDDFVCIIQCTSDIGLSSQCSDATFQLGTCAIGNCGGSLSDLNCIAEFCPTEYEAVFDTLTPECVPSDVRACYTGPAGTDGVGVCQSGTQTCSAFGFFEVCDGEVLPEPEICGDGLDNDCNSIADDPGICTDADGDGYPVIDDCDDSNPNINPGAVEICNDDIDNNCDALIDLDDEAACRDGDGDGWGGPLDCDDTDPGINPDATEVCDGVDNNCDDVIDEGCGCSYYEDFDGDGFGNPGVLLDTCFPPPGYVLDNTDCYDSNVNARPGQTQFFISHRGDGSFDYDCDASETRFSTAVGSCTLSGGGNSCEFLPGWAGGTVPACGAAGNELDSCTLVIFAECTENLGSQSTQACR